MPRRQNKTKATKATVEAWLGTVRDEERRGDCEALIRLIKKVTGEPPRMWASMVGFGQYHYKYESGHEGDFFQVGFASRKPDLVLYVMSGPERHAALLDKLGKHRLGKSCLYLRRLADADPKVLEKLLAASVRELKAT